MPERFKTKPCRARSCRDCWSGAVAWRLSWQARARKTKGRTLRRSSRPSSRRGGHGRKVDPRWSPPPLVILSRRVRHMALGLPQNRPSRRMHRTRRANQAMGMEATRLRRRTRSKLPPAQRKMSPKWSPRTFLAPKARRRPMQGLALDVVWKRGLPLGPLSPRWSRARCRRTRVVRSRRAFHSNRRGTVARPERYALRSENLTRGSAVEGPRTVPLEVLQSEAQGSRSCAKSKPDATRAARLQLRNQFGPSSRSPLQEGRRTVAEAMRTVPPPPVGKRP
mmetsp:Transcript_20350/g.56601  ORF Transcript_20350/g.56601 Transcript_20350/m.56601 type:complete len:279 (+) Transcript_20350:223-1059(+)